MGQARPPDWGDAGFQQMAPSVQRLPPGCGRAGPGCFGQRPRPCGRNPGFAWGPRVNDLTASALLLGKAAPQLPTGGPRPWTPARPGDPPPPGLVSKWP